MSKICYSTEGNPEMWGECPEGYISEEDWNVKKEAEEKAANDEAERIRLLPENIRASIKEKIEEGFDAAVSSYLKEYNSAEAALLFDKQVMEVANYHKFGYPSVFLENLAATRLLTVEELVGKIERAVASYDKVMSTLLGLRYYYNEALESLETTEQMLDLDITYRLTAEDM